MKKILLVDDEENIIKTLKARLGYNNYNVLAVRDTRTALEQIAQYKPDLIISDTFRHDGYDFCRALKSDPNYKMIPFMFLSAEAQKPKIAEGYAAGADLYMVKPFDSRELVENIRKLLDKG